MTNIIGVHVGVFILNYSSWSRTIWTALIRASLWCDAVRGRQNFWARPCNRLLFFRTRRPCCLYVMRIVHSSTCLMRGPPADRFEGLILFWPLFIPIHGALKKAFLLLIDALSIDGLDVWQMRIISFSILVLALMKLQMLLSLMLPAEMLTTRQTLCNRCFPTLSKRLCLQDSCYPNFYVFVCVAM